MTRPGSPLNELFHHVLHRSGAEPDATDTAVFTASLTVLGRKGTREATMSDVAAESGRSRATLFRRYGSKDALFERTIAFAVRSVLVEVADTFDAVTDPVDRAVETFVVCLRLGSRLAPPGGDRRHVDDLLDALSTGAPSLIDAGRAFVTAQFTDEQRAGALPPADAELLADALIRTTLGYLTLPGVPYDLTDPEIVRSIADHVVAPMLRSGTNSVP